MSVKGLGFTGEMSLESATPLLLSIHEPTNPRTHDPTGSWATQVVLDAEKLADETPAKSWSKKRREALATGGKRGEWVGGWGLGGW